MKYGIYFMLFLLSFSMGLKTSQLFEIYDKEIGIKQEEKSIFDILPNDLPEEVSFLQKKEISDLKNKIENLKAFDSHLSRHINKRKEYETNTKSYEDDVINLIQKSEQKVKTSLNNSDWMNKVNNLDLKPYSEKFNNDISFLQTKLAKVNSEIANAKHENENISITSTENAKANNLSANNGNFKSLQTESLDMNGIKLNTNNLIIDSNTEIVIEDKTIPVKYLMEYHKLMTQLRTLCGQDLTLCKYSDTKKIEEDAINQTTLLSEVEHLTRTLKRLNKY
jgi:hypothetical protein